MTPPDALQVILIAHAKGISGGDYPTPQNILEAIHNSFVRAEGNEIVRQLSLTDETGTGAVVRRFYVNGESKVVLPPVKQLSQALHTIVVVYVNASLLADAKVLTELELWAEEIRKTSIRNRLILLGSSEENLRLLWRKNLSALNAPQAISVERLGEYALRPIYAAILILHTAYRLLSHHEDSESNKPCFFISHAKLDGLPLAQALRHLLDQFPWLQSFYDAKDIQAGEDFKRILRIGVIRSMILVLRTDIYDLREWCRQEVIWAEQNDRPVLVVDARAELLNRASSLGFIGVPGVRIPDGNLVRIIIEALREWIRIAVNQRRFNEAVKKSASLRRKTELISRPPSLASLSAAIQRLQSRRRASQKDATIVYSGPPLDDTSSHTAQILIQNYFQKGSIISIKQFFAEV